jgi:7-carboxy-7-deazaguanine synthase
MTDSLVISEMFRSIQGETSHAGLPCFFVRTAGCNLRCSFCDTVYARNGEGEAVSVEAVRAAAREAGPRLVCITGGEPLLQAEAVCALARLLLADGHTVLLETNGTLDASPLPEGVITIMDIKCPGSGESGGVLPSNLERLRHRDEVKFVVSDRGDFDWALRYVADHGLQGGPQLLFAPVHGRLAGGTLAGWLLESGTEARLQLQLHKILWPDRDRGV